MAVQYIFPPAPTQNVKVDLSEADLVRRSASSVPQPARKLTSVAKLIDTSKCIGCKACESACLEWNNLREEVGFNHGVYDNPLDLTPESLTVMRFSEWINPETQNLEWLIRKDGCMHCEDPGCLKACPFTIPRISKVDNKAYKCTLCSDRVAVGQGPACAKACPTQAIVFGTKDEMKAHADARIQDLKSRGYKNAGLYDPPGVGGTHVMYVLHHADKPEIYANLPNNPRISPIVEVWKGV